MERVLCMVHLPLMLTVFLAEDALRDLVLPLT